MYYTVIHRCASALPLRLLYCSYPLWVRLQDDLPQKSTTYRQKAPIVQHGRRIDAQIAVRFCAICSIYIMPKALGDISTVSILRFWRMLFLFASITHIAPWQNCKIALTPQCPTSAVNHANPAVSHIGCQSR